MTLGSTEPTAAELRRAWEPLLKVTSTAPQAATYRRGIVSVRSDVPPPKKVLLYAMDAWRTSCADFFGGHVTNLPPTATGELRFDVTVYTD